MKKQPQKPGNWAGLHTDSNGRFPIVLLNKTTQNLGGVPDVTVSDSGGSGHTLRARCQNGASGSTYLEGDSQTPEPYPTGHASPTPAITATRTLTRTPGPSTPTDATFVYDGDGKRVSLLLLLIRKTGGCGGWQRREKTRLTLSYPLQLLPSLVCPG